MVMRVVNVLVKVEVNASAFATCAAIRKKRKFID